MFTGIIEEIGTIQRLERSANAGRLTIAAKVIFTDLKLGDSVAVNGVCLTASGITGNQFTADVMPETLNRTGLGTLGSGSQVNLERAMAANGRFGGHMVSGHIDGTGQITALHPDDNAVWVQIAAGPEILRYVIPKGSIAIDGISLTVAKLTETDFSVSIIPHTGSETTLLSKQPGDLVNLETDLIGKYVEKLLQPKESAPTSRITLDFLAKHGY
ncbi:MAG: riboflavin synthase [Oscillospiraceae bacterium]|nr:riboflavin synthase [Oscillospiraceae bacterium]